MGFTRVEDDVTDQPVQTQAQLETSAWVEGRPEKVNMGIVESGPYEQTQEELNPALVVKTVGDLARGLNRTGRAKMMESIADYIEGNTIITPENNAVLGTVLRSMAASEVR